MTRHGLDERLQEYVAYGMAGVARLEPDVSCRGHRRQLEHIYSLWVSMAKAAHSCTVVMALVRWLKRIAAWRPCMEHFMCSVAAFLAYTLNVFHGIYYQQIRVTPHCKTNLFPPGNQYNRMIIRREESKGVVN